MNRYTYTHNFIGKMDKIWSLVGELVGKTNGRIKRLGNDIDG